MAQYFTVIGRELHDLVELLEHVVAVQDEVLVEEHQNRLVSQQVLAGAYLANGRVSKAVKL